MNVLQAIQVEVRPYDADELDVEKALAGACKRTGTSLTTESEYDAEQDKTIAIAALSILKRYLSLTSENESEWSHGYSKEGLEERIKALCKENELDASEYLDKLVTLRDGSNLL